jgi:hypothetical protein
MPYFVRVRTGLCEALFRTSRFNISMNVTYQTLPLDRYIYVMGSVNVYTTEPFYTEGRLEPVDMERCTRNPSSVPLADKALSYNCQRGLQPKHYFTQPKTFAWKLFHIASVSRQDMALRQETFPNEERSTL